MNSNQRFVLILSAMALVGIAMMRVSPVNGQQSPNHSQLPVIRAQRIELVDKTGKVRMILGDFNGYPQDARGAGVLAGRDSDTVVTKIRSKGGAIPQMGILILDEQARKRVMLSLSSSSVEGPSLRMMDSTGYQRAMLRVGSKSDYGIDADATTSQSKLPESAMLEFYIHGEEPPVFLGGASQGQLYLFGKEGKFLHFTPENTDGLYHDPMQQFKPF